MSTWREYKVVLSSVSPEHDWTWAGKAETPLHAMELATSALNEHLWAVLFGTDKPEPIDLLGANSAETASKLIGARLRRWRKSSDLTLRQVSNRTGISIAYLSDLERGKLCNPSMRTIKTIASIMGVPAGELLS